VFRAAAIHADERASHGGTPRVAAGRGRVGSDRIQPLAIPKGPLEFPARRAGTSGGGARTGDLERARKIHRGAERAGVGQGAGVDFASGGGRGGRSHVGKPIEASQVRLESRDGNPFAEIPPVSFAGMTPRRPIRAGELISQTALEVSADVARARWLGIEARYGAAFVKFEVRAEVGASRRFHRGAQCRQRENIPRARLRKGWVGVEQTE